jgi:uncharacterized membrane protein
MRRLPAWRPQLREESAMKKNGVRPERRVRADLRYHQPNCVDDLTEQNVQLVAELDAAAQAKRTPTDRVVDTITGFCGRMLFVWVHVVWFGFWIALNMLPGMPKRDHFDPYPFQLLTLVVSLEAIFLSTFILISQNRQNRLAERRNHLDLQINLLAEQENTKVLSMLDAIHKKMGIDDGDPEVRILEEATRPDHLVKQIEKVIEQEPAREVKVER